MELYRQCEKKIVVISKLLKKIDKNTSLFHFRGVYEGKNIKKILVKNSEEMSQGFDYIIYAKILELNDSILIIESIKNTPLEKIYKW